MKKLLKLAAIYAVLGLVLGVYYREFTKFNAFTGTTSLAFIHVHTLVLGMFMYFIVTIFTKIFQINQSRYFKKFTIFYNLGLIITISMLTIRGTLQVLNFNFTSTIDASISGIAGLGHILLSIGLFFLFKSLFEYCKD